jgi:hypothetical protein
LEKLHNEELHNLYSSPSIIRMIKSRRMRGEWHVACMGGKSMHLGFWWESQKERPLRRPRCGLEDNIKMDLNDIRWVGLDWIDLAQDTDQWRVLVNMLINRQVP